jgi:hypothetical protein
VFGADENKMGELWKNICLFEVKHNTIIHDKDTGEKEREREREMFFKCCV